MNQVKTPWSYWNLKRPIISHLKQKSNFICKAYAVREASIWASASVLAWYLRIGQVHYRQSRVLHIHLLGICFIISFYQSVLDTSRLFITMRSEEISLSQHKIQLHRLLGDSIQSIEDSLQNDVSVRKQIIEITTDRISDLTILIS